MSANVTPGTLSDATVVDSSGAVIGTVGGVHLRDSTGEPSWISVRTGFFGTTLSLVPLTGAAIAGGVVTVPFGKAAVTSAPRHAEGADLSTADESALYRHYGISGAGPGLRNDDPTGGNGATHHQGRTYSRNAANVRPPAGDPTT